MLYIDGLVDSNIMNDFVLKPLMLRNESNLYDKNQLIENGELKTDEFNKHRFFKTVLREFNVG